MTSTRYFTPELFAFLRELKRHNDRRWFQRNKDRYEAHVRDPVLRFIESFGPRLRTLSRHLVADASPVGGSMMRIHRDLRFAKDKRLYKTAVGIHFWHATAKDGSVPAFYLHLEPENSSAGAGIWRPQPRALKSIRDAIAENPKAWKRATSGREFRSTCGMAGEALNRPPRGYDPNHAVIEDIKRKDFATSSPLQEKQICSLEFPVILLGTFRLMMPLARFLTEAVGLPF